MYDVFISYSTENETAAQLVRQRLEEVGISCWFAPEAVRGHEDFTRVIPQAIRDSKAYLLLMSPAAMKSKWVQRELGEADAQDKPIYTLFLEPCELDDSYRFLLRFSQHYNASEDIHTQLNRLIRDLRKPVERDATPVDRKKTAGRKPMWPWVVAGIALIVAAVIAMAFMLGGDDQLRDGKYVIWSPDYGVALSAEAAENTFYRAGEKVGIKNGKPANYSQSCVWELTVLDDGTFTLSHNGALLGATHEKRGVDLERGENRDDIWELRKQPDGTYRIYNTEGEKYLQWYDDKDNWTLHDKINDENRDQFALCITPVP